MPSDTRLTAFGTVSTALALLSDRALQQTLNAAMPIGSGIGGKSVAIEIAGTRVFVKLVPLTDLERRPGNGRHLYFADYALAISSRFELAVEELSFFDRHQDYDRRYAAMYASQWLVTALLGSGRDERESRLRAYARGEAPAGMPQAAAAILARNAPVAVLMTDFFRALQRESRQTPYPAE